MTQKVPPFIEETAPQVRQAQPSLGDVVMMGFGWTLLTVALLGGAYLAYRYLTDQSENRLAVAAPLLILGFTYLAGWVVSLLSIRRRNDLILPLVVQVYTYAVLGGILLVYFRAMYKIFVFPVNGDANLLPGNANFFVLFAGFILLVTLSLLVDKFYLKIHAIALLIAAAIHLVIAVYHYVFIGAQPAGLVSFDVYYLLFVLGMSFFLFRRYRFLRQIIGRLSKRG
ncbi:MAG: hypothetical protein DDG60_07135 [Anaerolineae bacterium]|nr:MAG: hypothetical protein DDG60_07135 [Anaerolineae bacterium]